MKFSQMPYERPDLEAIEANFKTLLQNFTQATTAEGCFVAYKEYDAFFAELMTTVTLAIIRNSLDTTDEFYAGEKAFWDEHTPKLQAFGQEFTKALLSSTFRKDMEQAWGTLMFDNAEIDLKTFDPKIIPDLQAENALNTEYNKLIASTQIEFDGKTLTLAQLRPYLENPDRSIRKCAQGVISAWFNSKEDEFNTIYDKLVKLRTEIAQKLGYENYIQLGYYRRQRNCYDQVNVAKFREGVATHIVPIVTQLKKEQAQRIGVDTIKPYDQFFAYPDGNAKPQGTADDILAHGKKMYNELSTDTSKLIDFMMENELFDVLTRPGKFAGGYCSYLPKYKSPFIFANFNGTTGDVDVFTHEVGHALANYIGKDIYPSDLTNYSYEIAEIHSMAMEFFTWPWMDGFFGEQTDKYYDSHLSKALFILTSTSLGDEFQHHIYQNPNMTPAERNKYWLQLLAKYMPWLDVEDEPFIGDGRNWHNILHFFILPFYFIDYGLAQIIALSLWAQNQENPTAAWEKYMRLIGLAGTKTFLQLIEEAGLPTPFEAENVKIVGDAVNTWLAER